MPTLMETTLKFDCTRLEEQVQINKEKDVQLDTRVTALEGKETPVYTPTDLDLNTGIVAVTYDTTDGISLTTQGTVKSNTGTDQVVVDYEIPVIAGAGISIDKKADADKIEVKLDKTQPLILEAPEFTKFLGVDFSAASGMSAGYLQMLISNYNQLKVVCPAGTAVISFPVYDLGTKPSDTKAYTVLTDKTTKTLFGDKSIYGSGNIDLYNHDIKITGIDSDLANSPYEVHVFKTSSNNLKVDSLTDLKTLLGNTFKYWNLNGSIENRLDSMGWMALYVTESSIVFQSTNTSTPYTVSLAGATFTDNVTTV